MTNYGKHGQTQPTVLEVVSPIQSITLGELWNKYVEDKQGNLKPKTVEKYENLTKLFNKLGSRLTFNAMTVKEIMLDTTTRDRTRDCLMYLSACSEWGVKRKYIECNPFKGMALEMGKPGYLVNPKPNAFTEEEADKVINAFRSDVRPGMNYRHYASLVEFLFFTGCRPSEATGLTWDKVSNDCSRITFDGSIQILSNGTKRVF